MPASSPVPKDHPLMVAWRAYLATEDFANTRHWANEGDESAVDGSLWAAFEQGWRAAGGRSPFEGPLDLVWVERFAAMKLSDAVQTVAEDPSVLETVKRGIAELLHQVQFWKDGEHAQAHAATRLEADLAAMRQNEAGQLRNLSNLLSQGNAGTWAEIEHAAAALTERVRELRAELESAVDRESARRAIEAGGDAPPSLVALVQEWQRTIRDYEDGTKDLPTLDGRVRRIEAALLAWTPTAPPAPDRLQRYREALERLIVDANRLCDRQLGGTYEDDCRRSIAAARALLTEDPHAAR